MSADALKCSFYAKLCPLKWHHERVDLNYEIVAKKLKLLGNVLHIHVKRIEL